LEADENCAILNLAQVFAYDARGCWLLLSRLTSFLLPVIKELPDYLATALILGTPFARRGVS